MKPKKRTYLEDDETVERRVTDSRSNAKPAFLRKYYRDKETEIEKIEKVQTNKTPSDNE